MHFESQRVALGLRTAVKPSSCSTTFFRVEKNASLRVYLGASKGKEGFYEKFGFRKRTDLELGEGMILKG